MEGFGTGLRGSQAHVKGGGKVSHSRFNVGEESVVEALASSL